MGLDMYLNKKTYVGAKYEHRKVKGSISLEAEGKPINIQFNRVSEITEEVGYWRKANHIHKWFVDNCQDGEDDCREAEVSMVEAKLLLETCKKVKENNQLAEELLPREEGFFFGGNAYDESYFNDINYTIILMEQVLEENNNEKYLDGIYYSSSW